MAMTPSRAGFLPVAEWAPHKRCWMAWPTRASLWGDRLKESRRQIAVIAREIARHEPVVMIANPSDAGEAASRCGAHVTVLALEIDDSWIRDSGPTFFLHHEGKLGGICWRFDGWGGKLQPYDRDASLARRVLTDVRARIFQTRTILEGSALRFDGEGTVYVTEQSLMNDSRNPGLDRGAWENVLADKVGAKKVIWIPHGLVEDQTGGHVSNMLAVLRPGVVAVTVTDDSLAANHDRLLANREALEGATDAAGRNIEIIDVPLPTGWGPGPRSYLNYYIANGALIMPQYGAPEDDWAMDILARAFPDRKVVAVDGTILASGGGGLHGITLGEPAITQQNQAA